MKFGRIERQTTPPPQTLSPYDLVTVYVGGVATTGRPYEFDSEAVDQHGRNSNGQPIIPTKAASACPDCGHGIDVDLRQGPVTSCTNCGLGQQVKEVELADPFCNPLKDGRVPLIEIVEGEDVVDVNKLGFITQPSTTVDDVAENDPTDQVLDLGPEPDQDSDQDSDVDLESLLAGDELSPEEP